MQSNLTLTYLGHATVLVELDGVRVLTDPFLRTRLGHLRRYGAPLDPGLYRDLDAVVISHAHRDHLDLPSLRKLNRSTRLIVARGVAAMAKRIGVEEVEELSVGETTTVGHVTVAATDARHARGWDPLRSATQCLGFLITGKQSVYFAGDTDLFPGMANLSDELDVALLPVSGWGPRLGAGHLTPERAAEALTLLRPRVAVPIHWGTLRPLAIGGLAANFLNEPPLAFAKHAAQLAPGVRVEVLATGRSLSLERTTQDAR